VNIWPMLQEQLEKAGEPAYVSDAVWHMPTIRRDGKLLGLVPADLQREARAHGMNIVHADAKTCRFEVRWHTS
jgi:hypothetical protein